MMKYKEKRKINLNEKFVTRICFFLNYTLNKSELSMKLYEMIIKYIYLMVKLTSCFFFSQFKVMK